MARASEPVKLIIAEALKTTPIRQAGPITDGIIDIVGLVDLAASRGELMRDAGDLTGGI